jgi:hypothetical protein
MKRAINILLITLLFGFTCCEEENSPNTISAEKLNFKVSFDESFQKTVYPSIILGLSKYASTVDDNFDFIKYSLQSPGKKSEVKIKLDESVINKETTFRKSISSENEKLTFFPMINWKYEKLQELKQPGSVDLSFTCYIDGKEVDNYNLRLSYRSVNECVYGIMDEEGNYNDLTYMFAGYVNEDHPKIDEFLAEVQQDFDITFSGYQGTTEDVILQVYSLWYNLQKKGVNYSDITNTSNPSDSIATQYVRFFEEVYNSNQANCVDGSAFLSSITKKISIKPFLVLVPGHMYMGYFTSKDRSSYELLETTMVGNIDLNEITADNLLDYSSYFTEETYNDYISDNCSLEYVKAEISFGSFVKASEYASEQWSNDLSKINDKDNYQYQSLDIENLRSVIQPIKNTSQSFNNLDRLREKIRNAIE